MLGQKRHGCELWCRETEKMNRDNKTFFNGTENITLKGCITKGIPNYPSDCHERDISFITLQSFLQCPKYLNFLIPKFNYFLSKLYIGTNPTEV